MKKASSDAGFFVGLGGEEEDRTPDLVIANDALSQLSYPPNGMNFRSIITWHLGATRLVGALVFLRKIGFKPQDMRAWNNAAIAQKHLNFYSSGWKNKL